MRWAVALVLVAGCGGGGAIAPPALGHDVDYPAGQYGYERDDVLPDLLFAGKRIAPGVDAGAVLPEMISLGQLRAGARYLLLETVGAWCSDCAGDQPAMMQLEADYAAKGVVGAEILLEGAYDVAAVLSNVDAWSRAEGASGILLVDDGRAFEHAADIIGFPTYFIVDTATMTIVLRSDSPLAAMPLGPTLDSLLQ